LNSFVNARRFRLAMTPLLPHFRAIWGVYQTGAGSSPRPRVLTWMRRAFAGAFVALGAKLALTDR
jgi:threonine/homoserine/homoserine lactone efflux protein